MIESTRNYLQITRCLHISKLLESAIVTAEKSQMSYLEFLHYLLEKECSEREQRSITRRLKQARLPSLKSFDDFDFAYQQSITKKQVKNWLSFVWIEQRENIILMGPPGVGKTHIAIALCYEAVKVGYKALFHNMNDLIEALMLANLDNKLDVFLNKLSRFDLIVVDEMGYLPLNPVAANLFFRFVSLKWITSFGQNTAFFKVVYLTFLERRKGKYCTFLPSSFSCNFIESLMSIFVKYRFMMQLRGRPIAQ